MSNLFVILVLLMTTFLSSLFSPARGDDDFDVFSFTGWWGSNQSIVGRNVPPGIFEVPIHMRELPFKMHVCIREIFVLNDSDCPTSDFSTLPPYTHLISKNRAVASVEGTNGGTIITIKGFGATILELRQDKSEILFTSYVLVVFTPSDPGKKCVGLIGPGDNGPSFLGVTDCSGKCVKLADARDRSSDGVCDNGMSRDDKEPDDVMDLSCSIFIDGSTFLPALILSTSIHDERCSPDDSCTAQFGEAPGFQFCGASARICSFNATIGQEDKHAHLGTCEKMCQQFRSQCVAALDNETPGCTPNPKSRDTCETPLQTAICFCERL
jgi:hypothetical protein